MEEDEQEQRRRKVDAGRAKLAHFRQRKTKGDCAHSQKKTAKRKGSTVDASVQEESPIATEDGGLLGAGMVCKSMSCSDTPDGASGAFAAQQEQDCELVSRPTDGTGQQQQLQAVHTLELEALRLSLNNMHTAQLELTQANLQKEKETALSELREMLNGRRAQELALLQNRQQCEMELVREQHAREKEAMALRCGQETAELKEKLRSEMEKNVQMIETLKQDWESERELCLENLRKELSAKHQSEMEDLQNQFQKELAEQRAQLEKMFQAKSEAEVSLKNLEAQHQAAIKKLQEDLQSERSQYLQDMELKFREREKEKQLELENLQASYEDLKAQSQEEIRHLWSQLESVRTNREEPSESRELLLAQTSHLEELEHLRWDFAQQQQRDRAQHECELEQLRVYFEKKLRDAEKTYQEDLTVFQQRLQETREDSSLGSSSGVFLEETSGRERKEHPDQFNLQLEQQKVKHALVEDHQEERNKAEEKIQLMKQELKKKEAEWELSHEDLKRKAEERLASMLLELREQTESEKQSIMSRFELREASMKHLQDQQAAQILGLERSLMEQQSRLRQLEQGLTADEALLCSQCGQEPPAAQDGEHTLLLREKEDCALQLMVAQNRFLEERKEIMEKFTAEQDAFLREAQEKHTQELQLLQQGHQQQLLSLRTELENRHQAELAERMASLKSEQRVLLETRVAELQEKHAAEISALETRHLSNLDALESCYLADIQTVQQEHRQALELLQVELAEQLQRKDSSHQAILTQELEKLKLKHDKELQSAKDSLRIEMSAKHTEQLTALSTELQSAHQEKLAAALCDQRRQLEEEKVAALDRVGTEVLLLEHQHQATLQELGDALATETQKSRAELAKPQELHGQATQVNQVISLSQEIEECRAELERLQQRRERENQEGANLICMLRADVDLSQSEGRALRDALRRLLGLFGETLKAAVTLKSRIGERVGLFLDHMGAAEEGQAPAAAPALDEMWSDEALLELDRTLSEGEEISSVAEISSHVCESFLMSPESTLECEQPIRRVYQSLGIAVDGLLEMALDSSRQLEEARQMHSHFEKEFLHKNEETAQLLQRQQEMLEHFREESTAKAELELELHTAEGLLEGFKVEKADLQEALGRKEESEQQLVLELESLQQQLHQADQELATLRHESSTLWSQKEALAAEAEAREMALLKEVESLTREQSEARKQSEKDRAALLSQMRVLESELEDQLSQHQGCAQQAEEVATLKQQLAALDKHLRSQRQFMDEQAAEREHEREEFQQEILRLEGQLRQVARPRSPGLLDSQCVQLDEKVGWTVLEKSDGFNDLIIKKELADQQLLIQEEEIKRLEETNANTLRQVAQLQEELEKQKKTVKELQDKESLKGQQVSDSLLTPMSQSRLDEGSCSMPPSGSSPEGLEVQLDTAQRTLLQRETEVMYSRSSEVEELKGIIENLQENQERLQKDKAEEIEQLHEVIEKLQSELTHMGPMVHELSDCQADSLHSELLCFQGEGPSGQALRTELEAALAAKETLGQLLAEQAQGHSQALEALQQRLQTAEEAASQQLVKLEHSVALREAEVGGMASRIQEFEAVLKAKEAVIVQRDLEIDAMNKQKEAHTIELEAILLALARFCYTLEQQPLGAPGEPPELQQLRVQCARLNHQLQVLHQRFLRCQMELDQQQAHGVAHRPHPHADRQAEHYGQLEQGSSSRRPTSAPHGCGQWGKEKQLEDCQLRSVDLIAQVKQLQEKLNCLVYSMAFQDIHMEHLKFQQHSASPCPAENGSSDDSHNGKETDASPPVDMFNIDKATWDLSGITKNQELMENEMPDFLTQEKLVLKDKPLSLQTSVHSSSFHIEEAEPQKDGVRVFRKDLTPERQPSLPVTPCSDAVSLQSADTSPQDRTDSLLWADASGLLCYPGRSAAGPAPQWVVAPSAGQHHVDRTALEKDIEDFIITTFDSQEPLRSPPLGLEGRSNGNEKSDCPGVGAMLTLSLGGPEAPTSDSVAAFVAPTSGGFRRSLGVMKEKDIHSKHVKALLQMVLEESHQILALSENQDLPSPLSRGEPRAPLDGCLRERQGLLETVPEKEEKDPSETRLVWSGELLQAVQEVFEKERETLNAKLQSRPGDSDLGPYCSLLERLEKVIQEQGDLQEKAQEHLHLPARSSLLSEIQALRAQLRRTHLQNQEKLQQLCAALTSAEARGSRREHQLRRQVELLAYKLEQEKYIASDLQKTLSKEQEKVSDTQKRLVVEQSAVQDLKSELHECKQENSRLLESLGKVQQEVLQLRSLLDRKENDLKAALEELECERGKERALQAQQEENSGGICSGRTRELKISLEKHRAQNNQLCVALKHERAAKDNLQKELQIECSRCEALLAQEQSQLSELQKNLEAEKSRSMELSEALQHERLLTEQLSRSVQEACARQETQAHHTLLRKLKAEKARTLELQVVLEKVQQQAVHAQQQLEAQAQERCAELRKEKKRELELQHQRDEHKIEQLQQTVRELRWKEEVPWGDGPCLGSPRPGSLELNHFREQQQELEKIRQQLLCVAGLLTSFVNHTVDRTVNNWTSSNEKAVSSLVHTLEELKSELSTPASSKKKMAAELQIQLVDVLLKDNDSLTKAISTVTQEKAELSKAVSRLEKTLKHHVQKGCTLSRPGKSVWKQDGTVLHNSSQHSDPGQLMPPASEDMNICHVKMEKLYLHYLRAESFRKALIYQKKYLLLLIGGFQDSEQETLSMIAHLGVFPSKADKKVATSRPFTKFRTAVRVVIAVLRLRFLVKKWQEVDRKGALTQGKAPRPGSRAPRRQQSSSKTRGSLPTRDVSLGHPQDSVHGSGPAAASSSRGVRSTSSPNSRLERSLTASQDPEPSLTEYIHHLEMVQQRLVGLPQDSTSKNSCHQKIKQ
uniref:Pericentrin/AKAP-450 centrosomal targeting domain-containing protein n=1 Tax=Castor canadensis TaxID=51338 RepID=A0A8C0XSD8_CASCN